LRSCASSSSRPIRLAAITTYAVLRPPLSGLGGGAKTSGLATFICDVYQSHGLPPDHLPGKQSVRAE
jgi:hypothetical protein